MTGGSLQAAVVLSQQLHDALGVAPVAEALFQHLRSRFQGLAVRGLAHASEYAAAHAIGVVVHMAQFGQTGAFHHGRVAHYVAAGVEAEQQLFVLQQLYKQKISLAEIMELNNK